MTPAQQLAELIGPHRVSVHPADLHRHAGDSSPSARLAARVGTSRKLPVCVVRPRTSEQVSKILKWANETKTPVVPYGGGSGVVEGIRAGGFVVIEMRAMNEIVDIDEKSRLVRTQAGVLGSDLDRALATWGFMIGHQPESMPVSTVGGWIATRSIGQLSAVHGAIEDIVAGMEVVLPDGRIARSKVVPRSSVGPDVSSLMIGSEGTLGIVTEATLRVSPLPEARFDRCIRFEHMADGVAACRKIVQAGLNPTVLRLYDREDTAIFMRNIEETSDPMLLLSFEGMRADVRAEEAVAHARGTRGDDALVEHWWQRRTNAVEEFPLIMSGKGILGPHAMVESIEVAGTWSGLRELYHGMKSALTGEADIVGCHISHAYTDGASLYFTLASACENDAAAGAALERWWEVAMKTCLAAGGTISHHHGVGRRRVPWLADELGPWWDVLKTVKEALDPNGVMNPGALGL